MKVVPEPHLPFETLEMYRRFYAEEIRAVSGITSASVVEAFARVPRERFVGPPPWQISSGVSLRRNPYRTTHDVRDLYHDVLVALKSGLSLNNGQPSLIAKFLDALELSAGKRVFHMGCGSGYYTALMAEVVGEQGAVIAVEIEPDLATVANINLAVYPQVKVLNCDGMAAEPGPSDAILINAGVTQPLPAWLSALAEGGVLVLPLLIGRTEASTDALAFRIQRQGASFHAEPLAILTIYPSPTHRDLQTQALLNTAFESHAMMRVQRLRTDAHEQTESCIVHARDFCLSAE